MANKGLIVTVAVVLVGVALVVAVQVARDTCAEMLGMPQQPQQTTVTTAPRPQAKAPQQVAHGQPQVPSPSVKVTGPKNGPVAVKWNPAVKFAD